MVFLKSLEIVMSDKASKNNKSLTDYLQRNMRTIIIKGCIRFQFKIATTNDLKELHQKGIKRLPAMIDNQKYYIGVPDIVAELHRRVKNSKNQAAPKNEEEIVRDFMMDALREGVQRDAEGKLATPTDDDLEDKSGDFMSKFYKEQQRREASVNHGVNGQPRQRGEWDRPTNTDRTAKQDDDTYETRRVQQVPAFQQAPSRVPPRADNIGDPMRALNHIREQSGGNHQDDDMMAALLERMGGDDM